MTYPIHLVFDTETTGMLVKGAKPDNVNQPHIVQLGMILYSQVGQVLAEHNILVKCPIPIPPDATKIHGITDDMVQKYGVPLTTAINLFHHYAGIAELLVAHNLAYDFGVIQAAQERTKLFQPFTAAHCTMLANVERCALPSKWGRDYKWPTLQELHINLFKEPFSGAHDAMADVRACARCFHSTYTVQDHEQPE